MEIDSNDAKSALEFFSELEKKGEWERIKKNAVHFLQQTAWNHCIAHVYLIKYLFRKKYIGPGRSELVKLLAYQSVLGDTEEGNLLAQPPELPLSLFHHAPGMLDFARQVLSFVAPPATKINVVEMSNYAFEDLAVKGRPETIDLWPKRWQENLRKTPWTTMHDPKNTSDAPSREELVGLVLRSIVCRPTPAGFALGRHKEEAKILTFGSCFAVNLVAAFRANRIDARNLRIEETINSPLANRYVLEYLLQEKHRDNALLNEVLSRESIGDTLSYLKEADAIIVTIGVALAFFSKDAATQRETLYLAKSYRKPLAAGEIHQRITSVAENRREIEAIYDLLRSANPTAKIILTLSPIPLVGAALGQSVVSADVLSKSTLRCAMDEAQKTRDFLYWPSFELVKWIAPHIEPDTSYLAYGCDDGNSRHASRWLTNRIVGEFCDYLFPAKA